MVTAETTAPLAIRQDAMKRERKFTAMLSAEEWTLLQEICRLRGLGYSDMLRQLIREERKRARTALPETDEECARCGLPGRCPGPGLCGNAYE